jgi:superfamily II DNA or RNA helicase
VRADGLSKVFEWYLGKIVYAILKRPKDDTVAVEALHYDCDDYAYTEVKTDFKGDPIRACMINNIADYAPRTQRILDWLTPFLDDSSRKLLILSDRREHLVAFETGFRERGISSIGYYVGGMKQSKLDESAEQQVILGTFAMASEGMNIPTLNAVLLATPKSSIEQSVGRILRLRPEERTVQPIIFDVIDGAFKECLGQWARRRKFYRECGYTIRHVRDRAGAVGGAGVTTVVEEEEEAPAAGGAGKEKKGVCLISDS